MNKIKLGNLQLVTDALSRVANEATAHSNGTQEKMYIAHYWKSEEIQDKDRLAKEVEIARAALSGKAELVIQLKKELAALPTSKINLVFKLMDPIKKLNGTKISYSNQRPYSPVMENVEFIHISQDAVAMEVIECEETKKLAQDATGEDTKIYKLYITGGILDVKEAIYDRKQKLVRAARAYVTPISFRSMQIAGKIMFSEEDSKRKTYGMTEML